VFRKHGTDSGCVRLDTKSVKKVPKSSPWAHHFQSTLRHLVVFPPKTSYPVAFERCFITDDRNIFGLSLGDQHTAKWIFER
jgi:hypothetical protein